ncbi:MAG TPA: serine/threonine-protein kinase [Thermoanaerobaculia bacterium]|nr:serine/threonine-protein kinase [Thermoanaerobaculia bacterium]
MRRRPILDADRWRRITELLDAALERPEKERAAWLAAECGEDSDLAEEVSSLLAAHGEAGSFLEPPARNEPFGQRPIVSVLPSAAGASAEGWAGRRVGNYTLVREIGRGGMSVVYLAERADQAYEHQVAVKLVYPGLVDPRLAERLVAERHILARLEHPNIARLLDGGTTEDGVPFFVLERIDGLPIDRHCDEQGLSIPERIRLFRTVCAAVAHAHRNLVVHRDLKPSNILVGADGAPKLLDFGIAKVLSPNELDEEGARTISPALTPSYASPEQLRGDPVTTATDIYSLGVVLYRLLTGALPRTSPTWPTTSVSASGEVDPSSRRSRRIEPTLRGATLTPEEIARRRATTPRGLVRQLAGDLDNILQKALRPEPERRYASAERLGEDLRRYLEHLPVEARPDGWGYRAAKFLRRNPLAAVLAGLLGLSSLGYGFFASAQERKVDREHQRTERALSLLIDLFRGADPDARVNSQKPTVEEVLDLGARHLLEQVEGEPEVEARLASVIGDVYLNLGVYDRAEPMIVRALVFGGRSGVPAAQALTAQYQFGLLRFLEGKHAEAERILTSCQQQQRALGPGAAGSRADTLESLGRSRFQLGRLDDAYAAQRESLAIRLRLFGANDPRVASSLSYLATIRGRQGLSEASLGYLRLALRIARRNFPADHPRVCDLLQGYGVMLGERGHLAEGEAALREALAGLRHRLGEAHPDLAFAIDSLATTLMYEGRFPEAEALYRDALAMRQKILGPEHPMTALTLSNLGDLHRRMGRPEEAEPELRHSLVLIEKTYGPSHLNTSRPMVALGRLLLGRGEAQEALILFNRSLPSRVATFAPRHYRIAEVENEQGAALLALGRREQALPLLRSSQADLAAALPANDYRVVTAKARLADIEETAGH